MNSAHGDVDNRNFCDINVQVSESVAHYGWLESLNCVKTFTSSAGSPLSEVSPVHGANLRARFFVLKDIQHIGWSFVGNLSCDFTSIALIAGSTQFSVSIGSDYPAERPILRSGPFPDQNYIWDCNSSLKSLLDLYLASFAYYYLFFKVLMLVANCLIHISRYMCLSLVLHRLLEIWKAAVCVW